MEWIRQVNPDGYDLEKWMREKKYTGKIGRVLLKNFEEGYAGQLNGERLRTF